MAIRAYHDFVIFVYNVEKNEHGEVQQFTVRVFSSPVGEGEKEEVINLPDEALGISNYGHFKLRARELERRELDKDVPRQMELGDQLAKLLLPDYARQMYWGSLNWLKADEGLRLRLRLPKELSDLPWEYMLVQRLGGERKPSDFIALNPRISIVRHEALAIPAAWFEPVERRRILVAMATPEPFKKYPKLEHLPDEQRFIKEALFNVGGAVAKFEPDFGEGILEGPIPGAQLNDVSAALQEGADIFHFSGHGEFVKGVGPAGDGIIGAGGIILANENNQAVPVSADSLLEIIRGNRVRLVVLGACETARRDTVYDWSSVAVSLLKGEITAVVAMQFTVHDPLAALFMGHFYEALAGRMTIDEAVYLGRRGIREASLLEKPDIRDWGAPVLYLRTPGGIIFPPISDEPARINAEGRSNGRFRLHQAAFEWAERGGTASRGDLEDLEDRREELGLEPTQALLLLRSAVGADIEELPWLKELRKERGERLIRHLDDPEPESPTGPEETLRILGLEPGTLENRSKQVGPVAWSAVHHGNSFTRRTAALALMALKPSPTEGLKRVRQALSTAKRGRERWGRHAELRGAMADADPEVEKRSAKIPVLDRLGAWLWRVRRRALRDRERIIAQMAGGALGAGIGLGALRALIARVGNTDWTVEFFIYSYLGAVLGLFIALGMSLAEPTLMLGRKKTAPRAEVARRATVLGVLFFAVGHFIVAILNKLQLMERPLLPVTGVLVGIGVCVALYDQPRAGRQLGLVRWVLRLGTAMLAGALAQSIIFWLGADYEATSISFDDNFYFRFYRRHDFFRLWMESTTDWKQIVMTADTALAGLVLALGTTIGITAAPRWVVRWRNLVGKNGTVSGSKE